MASGRIERENAFQIHIQVDRQDLLLDRFGGSPCFGPGKARETCRTGKGDEAELCPGRCSPTEWFKESGRRFVQAIEDFLAEQFARWSFRTADVTIARPAFG